VKIHIESFICVCVQEKQSVMASVYLSSAITLGPWLRPVRTSKNLRRKGGKFDHRLGRPKVLLRHWIEISLNNRSWHKNFSTIRHTDTIMGKKQTI